MNVLQTETLYRSYDLVCTVILFIATSSIMVNFLMSHRSMHTKRWKDNINKVHSHRKCIILSVYHFIYTGIWFFTVVFKSRGEKVRIKQTIFHHV